MSSSGIQNYLSNVFRQVYVFDTTAARFVPKLELSNIDTYSGNSVSVFTAAVGDAACNVYVGSNAGNSFTTLKDCRNVTAVGYSAGNGISNVVNSTYMGFEAGGNSSVASEVIAVGVSAIGGGTSNIAIGNGSGSVGISNIVLGHAVDLGGQSNQLRIGHGTRTPITADLSANWVGIGGRTTPTDLTYATIDISGSTRIEGNLGIFTTPGGRTLDVVGNFRSTQDGSNVLDFNAGITRSTGGFTSIQSNIAVGVGVGSIATLKKGIILVSAVDRASSSNHAAYTLFAFTSSNATNLSSNLNGATDISLSGVNIQISNTGVSRTYDYSVTYLPLP